MLHVAPDREEVLCVEHDGFNFSISLAVCNASVVSLIDAAQKGAEGEEVVGSDKIFALFSCSEFRFELFFSRDVLLNLIDDKPKSFIAGGVCVRRWRTPDRLGLFRVEGCLL